ncbi:DNA polymerase I [Campylobacter lanienae]|uniref:DNA polymerase I n=1 Tax=Campylobacter lanienae TaxID=75658 RepID=UPI00242DD141|nr:DNA polymerase I [Campylobacter lanienae]MDD7514954.1 DNA polymerase I [Campylobacter lanienae]MDY5519274.1 DNA polymerase I [Campylobacter lanienae]
MKTLTIIDTFGFFFRLYYAMSSLKTNDGKPSGMIHGFANFIANLKQDFNSDYIVFALDSGSKTFRNDIDPNYKANRSEVPKELKEQLPICIDMIEKMGLCSLRVDGYEADDIIASFIKNNPQNDLFIKVVTHDKDLYQLISDRVNIYSPAKKELYDRDGCYEKYGVYPEQVRDFLALTGDSADNIPGVKGIGDKGAKKLLDEFGSIENLYENLNQVRNERTKNLLFDGKDSALISKKLATLYDGLQTPDLSSAKFPDYNPLIKIQDILKEYSLNRLLATLNLEDRQKDLSFEPILITDDRELEEILSDISSDTLIAFDTETTSVEAKEAKIVGFSFCFNEQKSYYVPINHNYLGVPKMISQKAALWSIERIYSAFVVGHNLKYDFKVILNNFNLNPPKRYADTMIMAWLDNPSSSVGMDALAKKLYDYDTIKFENVVKRGDNFASVELESATKYAAEDAWVTLRFYNTFSKKLSSQMLKIAYDIEFDFILTLLDMEANGIAVNRVKLRNLIGQNEIALDEIKGEIYKLCGMKFNINSTKQLGQVLFDELKLPSKKSTKTGYSTDESVLKELSEAHPSIAKILEYRELYKLQSTYCEPILNLALKDENSRVYTSFIHTGTATGRLASKNPNLQNIPARGSYAKLFRSVFEARDGYSFLSLDYSQIELRLLAHFSGDSALISAFKSGEDIHAKSAINIFGELNDTNRSIAKSINFGLIYGMGVNKLSSDLGIDKKAAKEYIARYFAAFSSVKEYLQSIKDQAKSDGFVQTLIGRRRYFDFSNASPMQLAMYEREAVNTKFQGSAADIIKLSMLKIGKILSDEKMLLQIHDELIFEVKDEKVDEFGLKIAKIMSEIVSLNVPLVVNYNVAKNWGELK